MAMPATTSSASVMPTTTAIRRKSRTTYARSHAAALSSAAEGAPLARGAPRPRIPPDLPRLVPSLGRAATAVRARVRLRVRFGMGRQG